MHWLFTHGQSLFSLGKYKIIQVFQNNSDAFSIPSNYVNARRYFIICANAISIVLLAIGIAILLGNRSVEMKFRM